MAPVPGSESTPTDSHVGTNVQLPFVNSLVICAFITIAWYNVGELTVLIHSFFIRRKGYYYYFLLIATWGIFFHGLGTFLKFYHINSQMPGSEIADTVVAWVGWCMMVTGQSIVLYSRLNLVVQGRWARWTLIMIVIDGVVLHGVTGVLTFLVNCSPAPAKYIGPYSIVEKVQVSCFFVQEVILSGIYIWKTTTMLRSEGPLFNASQNVRGSRGRKVLTRTIAISLVIIALDVTILGLEFAGLYDIQTSYKGAVYSIKLKMEFTILNQLMNLVRGNLSDGTPTPKSHTFGPRHRSVARNGGVTELGHTAGAYSRMDEEEGIKLQELKTGDVLKTMTTEVRSEKIDVESIEPADERVRVERSRSATSSEVYIIDSSKEPV